MMGQTIVHARELQREELPTGAVHDLLAKRAQRTDDGATPPRQIPRTAMRAQCKTALGNLVARSACALGWGRAPRDYTARVLSR